MKNHVIKLLIFVFISIMSLSGCNENNSNKTIKFAISAEYPPFEYQKHGKLTGFDVELAQLVAREIGKEAIFENMQFSSILPALMADRVDAAISTISITEERKNNFDFSDPYYVESMASVFKSEFPIMQASQLSRKKVACQLGTTMEIWLKKHMASATIVAMDNNNQAIQALKAGHVEVVLMDGAQAAIFSKKNSGLSYATIAKSDDGYGVALKKGSTLKGKINHALATLQANGEIKKLEQKWFDRAQKWQD